MSKTGEDQQECQHCKQEIDDTDHLIEAFETVGKIICLDCWENYCTENEV